MKRYNFGMFGRKEVNYGDYVEFNHELHEKIAAGPEWKCRHEVVDAKYSKSKLQIDEAEAKRMDSAKSIIETLTKEMHGKQKDEIVRQIYGISDKVVSVDIQMHLNGITRISADKESR